MAINLQHEHPQSSGSMSEEEYLALDRNSLFMKYEYVNGVARLISGGSGEHSQISHNIRAAVETSLQSDLCFVRGSDMQVVIGAKPNGSKQYVYPDATVSCDVTIT